MMKRIFCFLMVLLTGHSSTATAANTTPMPVMASISIIADMVHQVGGDLVSVTTLVPPDGDTHSFDPTPADLRKLTKTKLLFTNGLGLEGWMDRLTQSAQYKGRVVVVSDGIMLLAFQEDPTHNPVPDPHAWQDLSNGAIYVHNIAKALIDALPERAAEIEQREKIYLAAIEKKHQETLAALAAIPADKRKIITSHDAFGYFGRAYGVVFLAPVGLSTDEEPSAATLARLVQQIKANHIRTIFLENMASPRLAQQLAHEANAKIGGTLYSDSLSSKNGAAPTYLGMFDNNVPKLLAAMNEATTKP